MPETAPHWTRHFICRVERTRTTWKFRLALLAFTVVTLWLTAGWWTAAMGRSLVCEPSLEPSDAILIDNFDPDYLLFERARNLRRTGTAPRVLVPISVDEPGRAPNAVALGIAEVMASLSRLGPFDVVPIRQIEPITLNAARDIRLFLEREDIRSVVVVTPLFRSRRSALIYSATLGMSGIRVACEPGAGPREVDTWAHTWHGVQNVLEQWIKLQYYRLYVLPFSAIAEGATFDAVTRTPPT